LNRPLNTLSSRQTLMVFGKHEKSWFI
jgi:hypothetical protein